MRYVAIIEGAEGCDYSIRCGTETVIFEAADTKEAINTLHDQIESYIYNQDYGVDDVQLFELSAEISVPLKEWRQERREQEQQTEQQKQREYELREYERLKKKFE